MGTQQLFLVILSIIIVAVTFSFAISLFSIHAYNSNKRSIATEMSTYTPIVFKYWNTNKILGGAHKKFYNASTAPYGLSLPNLANSIGFTSSNFSLATDDGEFRVTAISTGDSTVTLKGLGKEKRNGKYPMITATVSLKKVAAKRVTTVVSDATGW
jgi:hypothetical protein